MSSKGEKWKYKLFSVVEHKGREAVRGHYISYARDGNDWNMYDDKEVKRSPKVLVENCQAYMLFYSLFK
jgi:ubiquitin C-terminal hydrolase